MPEPKRSQLRRLLDRPEARGPVGKAVASLLGVGLLSLGLIGVLVIWHLVRRGRLIRERLNPPRLARLPELPLRPKPASDPVPDPDPGRPRDPS